MGTVRVTQDVEVTRLDSMEAAVITTQTLPIGERVLLEIPDERSAISKARLFRTGKTRFVFKAPFVEPIFTKGYLKQRPPESLVPGRIYLSTTAQLYPTVTAWNGAVGQANRTIEIMEADEKAGATTAVSVEMLAA